MADSSSSTSGLNNLLKHYFVPEAIRTVYADTPLYGLFKKYPQPKGNGNITYWNAWIALDGASSVLTEGGSNDAPAMSSRRVSATIAQYGRKLKVTDLAEFMTVLDAREGALNMLKESAKTTWERICHMGIFKNIFYTQNQSKTLFLSSVMSSLASSFCANTGTSNVTNRQFQFPAVFSTSAARLSAVNASAPSQSAQLSLFGIRKAVNRLERLSIKPMADGYYVAYTHPNAIHSLRKDITWKEWNQYTNSKETLYTGEMGKIYRVRFVVSSNCPRYAVTAHSVLPCFIFGEESVGVTHALGGLEMFSITTPDSGNAFNTYALFSYKITGAAAALNPSAGVILWTHEKI